MWLNVTYEQACFTIPNNLSSLLQIPLTQTQHKVSYLEDKPSVQQQDYLILVYIVLTTHYNTKYMRNNFSLY